MSVKIYRMTDRIPLKIGDVTFKLGPMSAEQKMDISGCYKTVEGESVADVGAATMKVLKYSVKDVEGIEYGAGGGEYKVSFVNGCDAELTDDCVGELLTLEQKSQLVTACFAFVNEIPKQVNDPITNKKLKGVEILPAEQGEAVKK